MRIPYVPNPPQPASEDEAAIVARIAARRAPRPLQALDLALLHSPAVADGWNSFLGAVRTRTSLDDRAREIAICRVAVCNGAWYEWGHHAPLARAAGVSEEGMGVVGRDVLVVEEGGDGDGDGDGDLGAREERSRKEAERAGLGEREWAVLRYADEMTRNVKVSDEVFGALRRVCSEREVVEVTATVAAYNCVSRFLVALDVGEKNGTGPDAGH
ncbi:AhpD-like protein [Daldinia decipiens]|uniref:AhpD-like protein n=1 Tax=Daldinia decipiens TaxID=326647 RepID=UPI0020C26856|nr:AhpD-like protein [Daldinia decipiens]KAI1658109.1 AhpD-like protein [Daldinia decipiens]